MLTGKTTGVSATATATATTETEACAESDFIRRTATSPAGSTLLNRHKYCLETVSLPTMLSVDVMKTSTDSNWQIYKPGDNVVETSTWDVGTIVIRTRIHAFGTSKVLAKTFKIDAAVLSFAPALSFPKQWLPSVSVQLTPMPGASYDQGAFSVGVNWTYSGTDASQNLVGVAPFVPRFAYAVNGAPRYGTAEPFTLDVDSSASPLERPQLRCDRGVASNANGFQQGCVFADAAAIMQVSKSAARGAEAAAHIEYAQNHRDNYKTEYSPGVFRALAGTRAMADESVLAGNDNRYYGLTRAIDPDGTLTEANRLASCDGRTGLIKLRPYSGSTSCPGPTPPIPPCNCDEYPFASTTNGAASNPHGTSVRYINKNENSSGGGSLGQAFNSERVFRGEKFWVRVIP